VGRFLPYFLDSNVIIGYCFFVADNWGNEATKIFEDPEKNFTSTTVCSECFGIENGGKCQTIKQTIVREFRRAIAQVTRDPSISNLLSITRDWKIFPILKDIGADSAIRQKDLRDILRAAVNDYNRKYEERMDHIQDPARLTIHRRTEGYKGIWQALNPVMGDPDDVEVVLDAHDLAGTILPIFMYTGDFQNNTGDFQNIYTHRKKILELTEISEVHFLGNIR
jgi:hypothetical protein